MMDVLSGLVPVLLVALMFRFGPTLWQRLVEQARRHTGRWWCELVLALDRGLWRMAGGMASGKRGFTTFLRVRPQPLFALTLGVYLAVAGLIAYDAWMSIDLLSSSTAAIGYLFVPPFAMLFALPYGGLVYVAGRILQARGARAQMPPVLWVSGIGLVVICVGFAALHLYEDEGLTDAVVRIEQLDDAGLNAFLDGDPYRDRPLALAAIATHPDASTHTLDRIASLEDPALHERLSGSARAMVRNRRGLAVMRLVARHPNVGADALARLAHSHNTYVLGDVALNRKTPQGALESLYAERGRFSDPYLIDWGLSSNPACPEAILRSLAEKSGNEYTLRNLVNNPATPADVGRLAADRLRTLQP